MLGGVRPLIFRTFNYPAFAEKLKWLSTSARAEIQAVHPFERCYLALCTLAIPHVCCSSSVNSRGTARLEMQERCQQPGNNRDVCTPRRTYTRLLPPSPGEISQKFEERSIARSAYRTSQPGVRQKKTPHLAPRHPPASPKALRVQTAFSNLHINLRPA